MASLKVYYDAEGKTLTVWFGDREGHVIGFERLNFSIPAEEQLAVDALAV
jgi:hypothetical protein